MKPVVREVGFWALLIIVSVVLLNIIEPGLHESPYNGF